MQSGPIHVYVSTESCLLREALVNMLTRKDEFRVAGSGGVTPETLRQVLAFAPDVLLADSSVEQLSRVNLMAELRKAMTGLKIVLFAMADDADVFLRAVRYGVRGYLTKQASPRDIVSAVSAAAQGRTACPPNLYAALFDYVSLEVESAGSFRLRAGLGLTRREQQLVAMLSQGLTNKEIAAKLFLSEYTIKNHVHRILKKLGAADRMAVVEQCRVQNYCLPSN